MPIRCQARDTLSLTSSAVVLATNSSTGRSGNGTDCYETLCADRSPGSISSCPISPGGRRREIRLSGRVSFSDSRIRLFSTLV